MPRHLSFRTPMSRLDRRAFRPRIDTLEDRKLLAAGALDTTLGGTGMVTTAIGSQSSSNAVAVQPDLKVVLAGAAASTNAPQHFSFARYNPDGSLDATFGTGGTQVIPVSSTNSDAANAVAIQSDGKIVAAGSTGIPGATEWALVRLNPDGTLDKTFGGGTGKVVTNFLLSSMTFSPAVSQAESVVVQADGKIVVAGEAQFSQTRTKVHGVVTITTTQGTAVVRYNTDGSLDTTFGSGGKAINTNFDMRGAGGGSGCAQALAIDSSGRINVGGTMNLDVPGSTKIAVERYLPNGSPDPAFGTGGVSSFLPPGDTTAGTRSLGVQSTGKIVILTYSQFPGSINAFVAGLVRLNANGTVDGSFGSAGVYTDNRLEAGFGMAIQPGDDKILAAADGYPTRNATTSQLAVTRVLADGSSVDNSFGTNGIALTAYPLPESAEPLAIALAPDGKILLTGVYRNGSQGVFAAFRFLGDTPTSASLIAGAPGSTITLAGAPDSALVPLVLDDVSFRDSLVKGKNRHA